MEELVSIVIPVYNAGNKIIKTLEILISQDYRNIEIIIVDDGSNDNTGDRCRQFERQDNRVKYFYTENRGSGPARNFGIQKSSGKYIFFPDADDELDPNAISIMVEGMKAKDVDLVVFGYRKANAKGKIFFEKKYDDFLNDGKAIREDYSDYFFMNSKYGIQGAPWNKLFDLNLIKENKIEFPSLRRHQDECFIATYMSVSQKVHFIPDVLYTYYANTRSMEWDKYPLNYYEIVQALHRNRMSNIYIWNEHDTTTHHYADLEYFNGLIKSFELTFSSKMPFKRIKDRYEWLVNKINEINFNEADFGEVVGRYNNLIYSSIIEKKYWKTYWCLKMGSILKKYNIITNW